jgi:hypothetical protein
MFRNCTSGLSKGRRYGAGTLRWGSLVPLCGLAALILGACVYDSSDRCSEHQVLLLKSNEQERCVCDDSSVNVNGVCVPCGSNEVPGPNGCVCASGFARTSASTPCVACAENEVAGANGCECVAGFGRPAAGKACVSCDATPSACEPAASGQGVACEPQSNPCTDSTHNYCYVRSGQAGYCTIQGCTKDAECSGGYACDTKVSPPVCRKPPDGQGKACTTHDECTGTEATFCNAFAKECAVQGCSLSPDDCYPGYTCCDLAKYGMSITLCSLGSCL